MRKWKSHLGFYGSLRLSNELLFLMSSMTHFVVTRTLFRVYLSKFHPFSAILSVAWHCQPVIFNSLKCSWTVSKVMLNDILSCHLGGLWTAICICFKFKRQNLWKFFSQLKNDKIIKNNYWVDFLNNYLTDLLKNIWLNYYL